MGRKCPSYESWCRFQASSEGKWTLLRSRYVPFKTVRSIRKPGIWINIPILSFTVAETDGHEVGIGRRESCRMSADYTTRSLRDKARNRKTFPEWSIWRNIGLVVVDSRIETYRYQQRGSIRLWKSWRRDRVSPYDWLSEVHSNIRQNASFPNDPLTFGLSMSRVLQCTELAAGLSEDFRIYHIFIEWN